MVEILADDSPRQDAIEKGACSIPLTHDASAAGAAIAVEEPPHLDLQCVSAHTNTLVSAYSSSGYPSQTTQACGSCVYNAFADLRCVSISTVTLPPHETIVVSPHVSNMFASAPHSPTSHNAGSSPLPIYSKGTSGGLAGSRGSPRPPCIDVRLPSVLDSTSPASGNEGAIDTLLHIQWTRRGDLFLPRPLPITTELTPTSKLQGLPQYVKRFPDGIHAIYTSDHIEQLLVQGALPSEEAPLPHAYKQFVPPSTKPSATPDTSSAPSPPPQPVGSSNISAKAPSSKGLPIHHTLTAVNTFSHLTLYVTAHQDNQVLLHCPVQTVCASISTRKITAQKVLLLARQEEYVRAGGSSSRVGTGSPCSPDVVGSRRSSANTYVFESSGSHSIPKKYSNRSTHSPHSGGGGFSPKRQQQQEQAQAHARNPSQLYTFEDISIGAGEQKVFCSPLGTSPGSPSLSKFIDVDINRHTVSVVPFAFSISPMILIGNQVGDLMLLNVLTSEVVLRLNYSTPSSGSGGTSGSSKASGSGAAFSSSPGTLGELGRQGSGEMGGGGLKMVYSPVACIEEVECGLEQYLSTVVVAAADAKRRGLRSFEAGGGAKKKKEHASMDPSLYAVGFDDGQVLLICLMCEGGWTLRQFKDTFGSYPITSIAVRRPNFFMRLWASYAPPPPSSPGASTSSTGGARGMIEEVVRHHTNVTIVADHVLHVDDMHIAAIACGNTVMLVQLSEMDIIHRLSALDFNAVGALQVLQWFPSKREKLLCPDLLIASGEDDTLTSFFVSNASAAAAAGGGCSEYDPHRASSVGGSSSDGGGLVSQGSSSFGRLQGGRIAGSTRGGIGSGYGGGSPYPTLRVVEKKLFHRSWVSGMALLPVVVPLRKSGRGMPQYHGAVLVAASYDGRMSYWPKLFKRGSGLGRGYSEFAISGSPSNGQDLSISAAAAATRSPAADAGSSLMRQQGDPGSPLLSAARLAIGQSRVGDGRLLLLRGPTAAYQMHSDLAIKIMCGGAGASFFAISVCCRGRVKCWTLSLVENGVAA